jgi:hypothetical protein
VAGTIIGAIVGGVGSFAGAAYTLRQQHDQHLIDARKEAYVAEISAAQKYRGLLQDLVEAVDAHNSRRYATLRGREHQLASQLYNASVRAYLLAPKSDIEKVNDLPNTLYAYFLPLKLQDCQRQRLVDEQSQGSDDMKALAKTARDELQS